MPISIRCRCGTLQGKMMWGMLRARLRGRHRDNPFFRPGTREPVAEPRVLTKEERARATPLQPYRRRTR